MKQNRRRGFTLVELLVVIAILAVLATVSIIGYSSFIKKANISNDQVVLEQMNMALISNEALSNKATYCDKAVEQCIEAGYILENLTPSAAGYYFAYDQKNNRFLLLDEELVYFFGDDNHSTSNYFIYVVVGKDSELKKANTNGYSTYLREGFEYNDENNTINTSKGIDVGKNVDCKKIEYVNDVAEQDVVIRTNNFDTVVSVNGALDTITHYGQALSIDIVAVANASYDEKGEVKGNIIVTAGHLDLSEAEGTYIVIVKNSGVKVTRNENTTVIVAGKEGNITIEVDGVSVSSANTSDNIYYQTLTSEQLALAAQLPGIGTDELPFEADDADEKTLAAIKSNNFKYNKTGKEPEKETNYLTFTATGASSVTIHDGKADSTSCQDLWYFKDGDTEWTKIKPSDYLDGYDNAYDEWFKNFKKDYIDEYDEEALTTICYYYECEVSSWEELKESEEIKEEFDLEYDRKLTIVLDDGKSVMFKGNNPDLSKVTFSMTGSIAASGSVTSLIDEKGVNPNVPLTESCFSSMFKNCTALTSAKDLELPATTLAAKCYASMFYGCTRLKTAPTKLPATTLAAQCYGGPGGGMFTGCTALTTAPELPATTLAERCYNEMFQGCSSLKTAPALSATTLATNCYACMFKGCTALTAAPALPATTLAAHCYSNMFEGCTSLATAPALNATNLAEECYFFMFQNCTSLTTAPELPALTLAQRCYGSMFMGCTSLTMAPELPAGHLRYNCYSNMFYNCTLLKITTTQPSGTEGVDWGVIFGGAKTLETYEYTPTNSMFDGCQKGSIGDKPDYDGPTYYWYK